MKKFIVKAVTFVLLTIISLFFIITEIIPPQFNDTYQYAINGKYKRLVETQSPKIIFLSGSSGAFGINEEVISKKTNMPVVNLALHAGMGIEFECELSKANIQKNDIVILGCEYEHWIKDPSTQADLIVTGIDNNIKLYKYIPRDNMVDVVKYFPKFALTKIEYFLFNKKLESGGVYQSSSFKDGNMIYDRPQSNFPNPSTVGKLVLKNSDISLKTVGYINEFNTYVNNKGAKLLITFPPIENEVLEPNTSYTQEFEKGIIENIEAPVISKIDDYIFSREYIYDTYYHCTNQGEIRRSELLANDIVQYLNNK
ncbi:hypothetical protein D2A34_04485 [Clostridium chromiireducens]|uniref:SGNH/GDSL hydrolase family protein n=1 Tax=Clostridium chromiireducens TaxID=225345 RepID=A0A399IU61_9CLOT|nr:hypothetical protein [Clostridium chromiireducens]RII36648.1 hypothetical protein D2A34_04485 [Clostridium chromiireducens]